MVTIQHQPTAGALVHTFRQGFLLSVSALRTVLACVGWIDRYVLPTSICCFVRQVCSELRPGSILDALSETVIVHHLVDGQVFHGNDIEAVDDLAALLMRKVPTAVTDALMDTGDNLAALGTLRCALRCSREFPCLAYGQSTLYPRHEWRGFTVPVIKMHPTAARQQRKPKASHRQQRLTHNV